jgi:Mg-chelatase subunit ChlI
MGGSIAYMSGEVRMNTQRVRELEEKIAELRRRMSPHSVPPAMLQKLEELEEELKRASRRWGKTDA